MFAMAWIREHPDAFDAGLARRGLKPRAAAALELDAQRRKCLTDLQAAQTERNTASREIGVRKAARRRCRGADPTGRGAQADHSRASGTCGTSWMPNSANCWRNSRISRPKRFLTAPTSAPTANFAAGASRPRSRFEPRDHVALGEALRLMDFQRSARMSGRTVRDSLGSVWARLERALTTFMMDLQTEEHGYQEVSPPTLVREAALYGTGQLPKVRGWTCFTRLTDGGSYRPRRCR